MLRASSRLPITSRIAAAFKRFRFPGGRSSATGFGSTWPGGWGWFGLSGASRYNYAKEVSPVWLNGVVLAAVNRFALLWNEAPLVVYRARRGDKPEMLKEHPALDLLAKPNDDYDDTVLWGSSMLSLLCAGNGYWVKEYAGAGNVVRLQYVPDHFMEPYWTSNTEYITGYKYWIDGKPEPIPRDRVVHLRWMVSDPSNFRKGLAPLAGELRSIAIDNEVGNYTASILRNMGIPGVIIAPKDSMTEVTPDQAEVIKRLYRERFTGDNRGEPFVPSLPIDVHAPSFSPEQMALDKIVDQPVPRICAALQVDPMVLGYPSPNKTYGNFKEAMESAYERTLIPLHAAVSSQMTEQIMPWVVGARDGDYFGRDYSEVRSLQEDADALYKRLSEAVKAGWLRPNDARLQVGLEEIEGGDELHKPMGGMGGGFGDGGQPSARAASLSPAQAAISAKWRARAAERLALSANGHG